jgi:biopolymer transport protein ExbB
MNESYGLAHLWAQGDWVIRGTTLMLVALSVASWAVMLHKGAALWREGRTLTSAREAFWHRAAHQSAPGVATSAAAHPIDRMAQSVIAIDARLHANADARPGTPNRDEWVARALAAALEAEAARQQRGLPLLASVSSTSPFIGLFGTVWGIYHALLSIGSSGQASLEHVAGPVGEALAATALGLAVAIPATFGYNLLTRYGRGQLAALRSFGRDLQAWLVAGVAPETAR